MAEFAILQQKLPSRYGLKDVIGSGGMGTVYLVRDRLRGRDVALKHIFNTVTLARLDDDQTLRFRTALTNEFRLLATLHHPNLVSVLDYGFDRDGTPFFTMEWLDKGVQLLRASVDLDHTARIDLMTQLLRGLFYVHRRGIVHRDLKPSNILVLPSEQGLQVKVLDFGLSIPFGQDESTSGTLPYLAPELISGDQITPQADLYAVGVLTYEMFVGKHPFVFDRLSDFIFRVTHEPPPLPASGLPEKLADVVSRLMQKEPQNRYADARATILALNEAVGSTFPVETLATRDSFIQAAKFVGRDKDLSQLDEEMRLAAVGEGRTWLVGGESGVGKSRLLDELRVGALIKGVEVVTGQAVEEGGNSYQVWLAVIRALLLSANLLDEQLAILNIFDLDLLNLLERPIPAPPELEASAMRTQLTDIIMGLVKGAQRPLLIVLEDIHWAAEDSLLLIEQLSQELAQYPVMIIGTYRSDEAPHLAGRLPAAKVLKLSRLDAAAVREMIGAMVGEDVAKRQTLVDGLQTESEGNAFFLVEMMRALAEQAGELRAVTQANQFTLPDRVRLILERRFASLSAETQALIQKAALVGAEINLPLMRHMAVGQNADAMLQEAAEYHVTEWRDGRWRFEHDKLRKQIVERLPVDYRKGLHATVALSLEAIYQDDSMGRLFLPLIALNWEGAGEPYKALSYLITLAQDAFRVAAYHDALGYVTRAVACAGTEGEIPAKVGREVMDAFYMQFYAHRQREERDQLWVVYERALALAERAKLPDLFLRAYQLGADAGALTYMPEKGKECAQKMLDYSAPGSGEAVLAQYRLSQGYRMERRFQEAIDVAEKALQSLDRTQAWRGWSFETSLFSYFALTSFFENVYSAAWSFATSMGYCYGMQGDYPNAIKYIRQSLEEIQNYPNSNRVALSLHNLALILQGHGAASEALELAMRLQTIAPEKFPALIHTAGFLVRISEARVKGDLKTAATQLAQLAQTNFDEQEIEDGILCARDAVALYEQLADGEGAARVRDLLEKMKDPLLKV